MILKADRIADLLQKGEDDVQDPLVIAPQPAIKDLVESGSASVDLRLGTWFVALRQARVTHWQIDNPPSEAQLAKSHYVPFGSEYILHPKAFVLGTTLEWIRLPKNLAAYVVGKSSWGRHGLIIATATGVHPGFTGCLTLELTNVGEIPVAIRPGMTICQLFFHSVEDSGTDHIDQSRFVCMRKPSLGTIRQDEMALKLGNANY